MEIAEGKGLNPYFEGQFDGESDELRALRLTLVRERDEARAEVERLRSVLLGHMPRVYARNCRKEVGG